MRSTRCARLCLICFLAWPPANALAAAFQFDDLQKIVTLGDPQISPDGKEIALTVSTPDWKTDKAKVEIDLVEVASGARRTLIFKRESLSSPRWSPDGSHLAFLAKDPKTKETQIFVMRADGGDALRVTDNKQGVDDYSWSPDGKSFAFVAQDEP
ncbi:MAG TPA: hypothetical protein VGK80_06375, partial [Rhodanobacteraceae bacterium]